MRSTNRLTAILVLLGILAVLTFGTAWVLGAGPFHTSNDSGVIATVDGKAIYLSEAQARVSSLASVHSGGGGPLSGEDWPDQILQSLVDDRLVQDEAVQRGITVAPADLAASVQELMDMFPNLTEYESWVASQNIDQGEVERRLEMRLLTVLVYDAVTADVTVTDEQVRAYYEANPDTYTNDDGSLAPFGEVKSDVRVDLETQQKDVAFTAWLDGRRESAKVVIVEPDWWKDIR